VATECVTKTPLHPLGRPNLGSRLCVVAAAAVPAALYLLYVIHYAVNVPFADDWQVMPLVSSALHGHLNMSLLWSQWSDAREVTGRLVDIAFGLIDHLNERAVMLFSAVVFIATYILVLCLFRSYLGKRLTALPVFVVGIAWFCLVDWQSALWSTVVNGYLVLFFVVLAMYLLLVPRNNARLSFGFGVVAAVLASLSFSFGFLVWPLGLICLLWVKRSRLQGAIWILAAALMVLVYFHGYNFANGGCPTTAAHCSLTYGLSRPSRLIQYYVLLVGNIVPLSSTGLESHLWVHDVQGAILLLAAVFVVVQTFRERRVQPNPLPLLLIVFGLLYDLVIAPARFGVGLLGSLIPGDSRYTMPNVLLLVAIVIYVWEHAPRFSISGGLRLVGYGALVALLLAQSVFATVDGISNGRIWHQANENSARIVVNFDRVPPSQRACYSNIAVLPGWLSFWGPWYVLARRNQLSAFEPGTERLYRAEGLLVEPQCNRP
jgi:hypothetical protein